MALPTDYDVREDLTLAQLRQRSKLFQILCLSAIKREGYYTYTQVHDGQEWAEKRILVVPCGFTAADIR